MEQIFKTSIYITRPGMVTFRRRSKRRASVNLDVRRAGHGTTRAPFVKKKVEFHIYLFLVARYIQANNPLGKKALLRIGAARTRFLGRSTCEHSKNSSRVVQFQTPSKAFLAAFADIQGSHAREQPRSTKPGKTKLRVK